MNIQAQYRVSLDRLVEETSSLSLKEVKELDSKELSRTFMIQPDLHRNIEMFLQAICVGCIKLLIKMSSDVFLKNLPAWKCL
jgi:CRISPR/Cas system-associated protein Csx1